MPQHYGLSETEFLIMEMIWNYAKPLRFNEIMDYFSNKGWKKQTLHTYLTRLVEKGVLSSSKSGNINIYQPSCTKEEYIQRWTRGFIDKSFDGSLRKFMLALTGNRNKLSPKELEELRDFLKE